MSPEYVVDLWMLGGVGSDTQLQVERSRSQAGDEKLAEFSEVGSQIARGFKLQLIDGPQGVMQEALSGWPAADDCLARHLRPARNLPDAETVDAYRSKFLARGIQDARS